MSSFLDDIKWDAEGLVPAIAQDSVTNEVLMFAWMNREALRLTRETGKAVYWSRSRKKLWRKGEQSGHVQQVKEIRVDCDHDVLLLSVEQQHGIACHTGRHSCFFHRLVDGNWQVVEPVLKGTENLPAMSDESFLEALADTLESRKSADPAHSYVAKLLLGGQDSIL